MSRATPTLSTAERAGPSSSEPHIPMNTEDSIPVKPSPGLGKRPRQLTARPKIYHFNSSKKNDPNNLILDSDQKDYSLFIAILAVMVIIAILLGIVLLQEDRKAQSLSASPVPVETVGEMMDDEIAAPERPGVQLDDVLSAPASMEPPPLEPLDLVDELPPEEAPLPETLPKTLPAAKEPPAALPPSESDLLKTLQKK